MKSKLKKVEFAGKQWPVSFGKVALWQFCEDFGYTLADLAGLGDSMTLKQSVALIFHGLKDGARKAGQEFGYSLYDIGDLLDEDEAGMQKILDLFADSQGADTEEKKAKPKAAVKP